MRKYCIRAEKLVILLSFLVISPKRQNLFEKNKRKFGGEAYFCKKKKKPYNSEQRKSYIFTDILSICNRNKII